MKEKVYRLLQGLSKIISPQILATVLAAIISGVLLFVWPIHGLADNGDFYRSILSNGIYRLPTSYSQYSDYVIPKFGILQYFNENENYKNKLATCPKNKYEIYQCQKSAFLNSTETSE